MTTTTAPEPVPRLNPFEGITYVPTASPENKFAVTVIENGKRRILNHFASITEAQHARDSYLAYHANKRTRETATYFDHYESRPYA